MNNFFSLYYLLGLGVGTGVRLRYGRRHKDAELTESRTEHPGVMAFMALWGISQLLPLLYLLTGWLAFADYTLPTWAGWIGVVLFTAGVWLLWRSHVDLGDNWSGSLEVRQAHTLVIWGVYRHIRHPMYAAHILWAMGQPLLIQNWLAGWLALFAIVPLVILRIPVEEELMLNRFGAHYAAYSKQTGRLLPKFGPRGSDRLPTL
ncbi:MAG: isoprenylcysteine carboxylmethyltransferase family protein [Caldilineaceae bacterium]|nr:isoprenylcysteine carboxylmethyltransferase family protein [Caldilineaceae bacterium]